LVYNQSLVLTVVLALVSAKAYGFKPGLKLDFIFTLLFALIRF